MKKYLSAIALICAALMASACLCACNGGGKSSAQSQSAESKANDASQSIVGSWSTMLYGDEYVYTFNEDGSGVYNAAGKEMKLKYSTKDGIYYETFEGSSATVEHPYRVENNQFIVQDSYGQEIVYNKKYKTS